MDKKENITIDLSSVSIISQPENVSELLNKYGTYEIQPTADSDNFYPTIAQGKFIKDKSKKKNNKS